VHLASIAEPDSVNAQYLNKLKPNAATSKRTRDAELGKALWKRTEALLGLRGAQWTPETRTSLASPSPARERDG
jgi:hypothetical protein